MIGVVTHDDAAHYLANARIALSAIYHQPKPIAEGNSYARKDARKKPKSVALKMKGESSWHSLP